MLPAAPKRRQPCRRKKSASENTHFFRDSSLSKGDSRWAAVGNGALCTVGYRRGYSCVLFQLCPTWRNAPAQLRALAARRWPGESYGHGVRPRRSAVRSRTTWHSASAKGGGEIGDVFGYLWQGCLSGRTRPVRGRIRPRFLQKPLRLSLLHP